MPGRIRVNFFDKWVCLTAGCSIKDLCFTFSCVKFLLESQEPQIQDSFPSVSDEFGLTETQEKVMSYFQIKELKKQILLPCLLFHLLFPHRIAASIGRGSIRKWRKQVSSKPLLTMEKLLANHSTSTGLWMRNKFLTCFSVSVIHCNKQHPQIRGLK